MNKTILIIAAGAIAGCASVRKIPEAPLNSTQAVIQGAEASGAGQSRSAQAYLQVAKDEYAAAEKMQLARREDAMLMLARAQVDAELARELARESRLRTEATKVLAQVQSLKAAGGTP